MIELNNSNLAETGLLLEDVKTSLAASLQLGNKLNEFTADSRLLGELPELDSMAIVTVVTGLEDHFGIVIDDEDLSAETFETVGSLTALVEQKLR
jgi:acyl carrier protein